ncbi:MAG: hypothetical protein WBK20_10945 [Spirochaetota bacterium]
MKLYDPDGEYIWIPVALFLLGEAWDILTSPRNIEDYEKNEQGKWIKTNTGHSDKQYAAEIIMGGIGDESVKIIGNISKGKIIINAENSKNIVKEGIKQVKGLPRNAKKEIINKEVKKIEEKAKIKIKTNNVLVKFSKVIKDIVSIQQNEKNTKGK